MENILCLQCCIRVWRVLCRTPAGWGGPNGGSSYPCPGTPNRSFQVGTLNKRWRPETPATGHTDRMKSVSSPSIWIVSHFTALDQLIHNPSFPQSTEVKPDPSDKHWGDQSSSDRTMRAELKSLRLHASIVPPCVHRFNGCLPVCNVMLYGSGISNTTGPSKLDLYLLTTDWLFVAWHLVAMTAA